MSDAEDKQFADEALELCRAIAPLFNGRDPSVVGACLADLLAAWLAAHYVDTSTSEASRELREDLLEMHVSGVRKLIQLNDMTRGAGYDG